ncbi:Uma2 family endonuclease [Actinosynnema sp. CS-041913]|uniref:Uma2 family endonuclease n=1 Tax=Actinosynnema sp. CS-041913 TaxID=3239917 RepID=UPI003D943555
MAAAPGDEPQFAPPRASLGPHTVEDWLDLEPAEDGSRTELILGHLFVTPLPSIEHQTVAFHLAVLIQEAIREAGRTDLRVVPAVGVRISAAMRTAVIPDVVVLDRKVAGASVPAEALELAVEVWSPGNPRAERETKVAGYADAGVPFFWAIDLPSKLSGLRLTAHRLENGLYKEENILESVGPEAITASPVPITLDLADLADLIA